MPKITRYGHQRRGNVKAAPAGLTSDLVTRILNLTERPFYALAPAEEVEQIAEELERSLADVPATIRGNLDWGLLPYQRAFARQMGVDLASGPDKTVEVTYGLNGEIIAIDEYFGTDESNVDQPEKCGTRAEDGGRRSGPADQEGRSGSKDRAGGAARGVHGLSGAANSRGRGASRNQGAVRPQLIVDENGYDTRSLPNPMRPQGITQEERAAIQARKSEEIPPEGASGTARKARSVASSGATSRRSARAPHVSQPVVDNRSTGGEPHVVFVPSHRTGKTATRDWIMRRHEVLDAAIRFLKARCILVDVVDRAAPVRSYRVSGKREAMYLEGVVALAESLGFEVPR